MFDHFPMLKVKGGNLSPNEHVFSEDFRVKGYLKPGSSAFFPITMKYINSENNPECFSAYDEWVKNSKNKELSLKSDFTIPVFLEKLLSSPLWKDLKDKDNIDFICPDVLSQEIINLAERIYYKIKSKEQTVNKTNRVFEEEYGQFVFGSSSSKERIMKKFQNNEEKNFAIHLKTSIEKKFPRKSRKQVGSLFFYSLMENGISTTMDRLSHFILINQLVYYFIKTGEDLSISDIFPQTKTINRSVIDSWLTADEKYHNIMYNIHKKFNNLTFNHHKYTNCLTWVIFQQEDRKKYLNEVISLGEAWNPSNNWDNRLFFRASDLITLTSEFSYSKKSEVFHNETKHNHIDEKVSPFLQRAIRDFHQKAHQRNITAPIFSMKLVNEKDDDFKRIINFNFNYREYSENISLDYGQKASENMKKIFAEYYLPKIKEKTDLINEKRNVEEYIPIYFTILTTLLISQVQFFTNKESQEIILGDKTIEQLFNSTINNLDFFERLEIEDIAKLAQVFTENKYTIPINLIRNIHLEEMLNNKKNMQLLL